MAAPFEVAFTSDESGQLWNTCMWDISTGTILSTFKSGVSKARTLSLIGCDYLISAAKKEPYLQIWSSSKTDPFHLKMITAGKVNCLAVCPDGMYCVAGIEEKLNIWQISSGDLLAAYSYHYQPVVCLKFTDDGSHFISAGEDGLVLVWDLSQILSMNSQLPQPRHIWSHHSLPVTDICIGYGGIRARVATCSLDQTCKLYELASGRLLVNIIMESALTSITMSAAEYYLFVGALNGNIHQINLFCFMKEAEMHLEKDNDRNIFKGHRNKVSCLSVSFDGKILLSGSDDQTARLWNIQSKQCIRILDHKGPVTNALLTRTPLSSTKTRLPVNTFERQLRSTDEEKEENKNKKRTAIVHIRQQELPEVIKENQICYADLKNLQVSNKIKSKEDLIKENSNLLEMNRQLYLYSINAVLNSIK